ncbi:hypothetical protein [Bounagaea algeriensis]
MNRRIRMATLLLKGEWLLDDVAYRLGGDRCTPEECRDTARALEELAGALHDYARRSELQPAETDSARAQRERSPQWTENRPQ